VKPQALAAQFGVAWNGVGHRCPQLPQFAGSDVMFTHVPAQYVVGDAHTLPQCPPEHTVPGAHTVPQLPQLELVVRSSSQPLAWLPSQLPQPAAHDAMPHVPLVHEGTACGKLHTVLHELHAVAVVFRFVSHPLAALPSQSPKPGLQVCEHTPIAHAAVAFAPAVQAWPHALQFAGSVLRVDSQPFAGSLSQSP
jgi:hypothetical protein